MNDSNIFRMIEEIYFNDKYKEVIDYWEKNKAQYPIDNKSEDDNKILEAIATSYFEVGEYDESLNYVNIQIKQLDFIEIPKYEKEKKLRYYYLNKINIYNKQNKRAVEYKTLWEYLQKYRKDTEFLEMSDSIEEYFYKKYQAFNKYFRYVILFLIVAVILIHISDVSIPNNIYGIYNVFSIVGIAWIVFNMLASEFFRNNYLTVVRYLLRPRLN